VAQTKEMVALRLVDEIKNCHKRAVQKVAEGFEFALKCGELLAQCKDNLGHGNFGGFIDQYFDFSERTARGYIKLHKDLERLPKRQRAAVLKSADSVRGLQKMLPPPDSNGAKQTGKPPMAGAGQPSRPGEPGAEADPAPVEPGSMPDSCPNCGGSNYDRDEDGEFCADCKEPAGLQVSPVADEDDSTATESDQADNASESGNSGDTVQCPWCNGSGRMEPGKAKRTRFKEFRSIIMDADLPKTHRLRKDPRATERAYNTACKRLAADGYADPEGFLVTQIRQYVISAEATDNGGSYCPLATTWLNSGRCEQDPAEWARNGSVRNSGEALNKGVVERYLERHANDEE